MSVPGLASVNFPRAAAAGIAGTLAMTVFGVGVAPLIGIPRMNPAEMLAAKMGDSMVFGWAVHLMIGIILAVIYAAVARALPGPAPVRGALYSLAPFLVAQLAVMPLMGMPVFSGSAVMAVGSLLGHLIYGAVVGGIYGTSERSADQPATA